MKKIFTLMALLMMATWVGWGQKVWNGTADTDWYNDNPDATEFTINTAEELAGLAKLANESPWIRFSGKTINLGANIVLNNGNCEDWETNTTGLHEWNPIGSFNGSFNGQGYTISGLYINRDSNDDQDLGLFGSIGDGSSVQNLKIVNSYIKGKGSFSNTRDVYIGGIVGEIDSRSDGISYCGFDGIISADYNGSVSEFLIGGVCGGVSSAKGEIAYCYNNADIKVNLNNLSGALVAFYINGIGGATIVSNSCNAGNIYVTINNSKLYMNAVAGISVAPTDITSCYNIGNITLSGSGNGEVLAVGGLGGFTSKSLQYCYNTGTITTDEFSISTSQSGFFPKALMAGIISGYDLAGSCTFTENYYLPQGNLSAVGESQKEDGLIKTTDKEFKSGKIAHALRDKGGYGQNLDEYGNAIDETPVLLCFAGEEQKVYKLTLESDAITEISGDIYLNAEPAKILQEKVYNELMADAEEGKDLIWKNTEGDVVAIGNDYTPSTDETLTAEWGDIYTITTEVKPTAEAGIVEVSKPKAQKGDKISFTVTANEGYEFVSVTGNATFEEGTEAGSYTFTMPAENVVITATFKAIETGGDDDDEGGIGTKRYQLFLADRDFYLNDKYDAEGLVLFSRHDKRYAEVGGSFTVYYEKDGEVNAGDYRIFWSKSANGEYKEVKLDEVSGYYQIRNVQSDVYVKIYGRDGCPVSNEAIEATEARAYAQANKIIVVTHEPMDVQIVSMAGAVVGNAKVAGQQEFGNLAEGVYIVRLGDTVVKLQVRN